MYGFVNLLASTHTPFWNEPIHVGLHYVIPYTKLYSSLRHANDSARGAPINRAMQSGPEFGMRHGPCRESSAERWEEGYGLEQFVYKCPNPAEVSYL